MNNQTPSTKEDDPTEKLEQKELELLAVILEEVWGDGYDTVHMELSKTKTILQATKKIETLIQSEVASAVNDVLDRLEGQKRNLFDISHYPDLTEEGHTIVAIPISALKAERK